MHEKSDNYIPPNELASEAAQPTTDQSPAGYFTTVILILMKSF